MRALATGLLLAMAGVFAAAALAERRWVGFGYLRAFAEAALVGGCADWFAVTALFRRPLGLPIPHTAVIPRGKDRIGAALGRFIVDNFLSPRLLEQRLRRWDFEEWGGAWLADPAHARLVADRLLGAFAQLAPLASAQAVEEMAASLALSAARAVPAAPAASMLLALAWDQGRAQPVIERAAELLGGYLESHQEVILEKVQAQSGRWMPAFVDRAIARKITAGLIQLLSDVRQADHPWRRSLGALVERWVERLAHDPELRADGERLKARLLADPRLAAHLAGVCDHLRRHLGDGRFAREGGELRLRLERLLVAVGAWLRSDPQVRRTLRIAARTLTRRVLAPQRHAIAGYVARTVEEWDARAIVERLEIQVGPDLQYVRLNGTLVGGLIGLALYALTRLFQPR